MIFTKQTHQTPNPQPIRLTPSQPFIHNGQLCWSSTDLYEMENYFNKESESKDASNKHWLQ